MTLNSPVNQPPTAATRPIYQCALNQPNTIQIPASDPDGDTITFTVSAAADSGLLTIKPATLSLSSAGLITWMPSVAGLYAFQAKVADSKGAYTVVDLILSVVSTVSQPPVILLNNSPSALTLSTLAAAPVTFTVKGTDPEGTPV